MDLFSRRIIGWAAGPTTHRELVLNAVLMAASAVGLASVFHKDGRIHRPRFFHRAEMAEVTIPPRFRARVKQRLKVLAYVEDYGVRPAARHFVLSRITVRAWRDRYRASGVAGLLPRYPKRRFTRIRPEIIRWSNRHAWTTVLARTAPVSGCSAFMALRSPP